MTPLEAYSCDSTFRELVDVWVRERRCPHVLVDRCLELEMPDAAECARWAATEPDRKPLHEDVPCGPMPIFEFKRTTGSWVSCEDGYCSDVPPERVGSSHSWGTFNEESIEDAILWLLSNWKA